MREAESVGITKAGNAGCPSDGLILRLMTTGARQNWRSGLKN
jgi:hypothetical protein